MTKVYSRKDAWTSCPNPKCPWHNQENIPKGRRWYKSHGYYKSKQHGHVARYVCLKCGVSFSERTLAEDVYLHYDDFDISEIGMAWLDGVPLRDIAKEKGITVSMVRTRLKRFSTLNGGQVEK